MGIESSVGIYIQVEGSERPGFCEKKGSIPRSDSMLDEKGSVFVHIRIL
jgi:hypothetical protein